MRHEFERWAKEFPAAVALGDSAFAGSPVVELVQVEVRNSVRSAIHTTADRFIVDASAGQGGWTHTPWVAILDPGITSTVQEGYYVVYLLSADGRRLYLTLNQGCTVLKNEMGIRTARVQLQSRAGSMRAKLGTHPKRLRVTSMNLGSRLWRANLYENGRIVGTEYDTAALPDEKELEADLAEAIELYKLLRKEGGWIAAIV